jgi:hypothetical protein
VCLFDVDVVFMSPMEDGREGGEGERKEARGKIIIKEKFN